MTIVDVQAPSPWNCLFVVGNVTVVCSRPTMLPGSGPDIVVTDLKMPQLNGAEVLERLRRIRPDVRVLLASGYLGLSEHGSALRGLPLVRKPFNLSELAFAVHHLLRHHEVAIAQA